MGCESVTYRTEAGRTRTVRLENPTESMLTLPGADSEPTLVGTEVDRDGVPVDPAGQVGTKIHIIQQSLITRRVPLVQDLHYGGLVPADRESPESLALRPDRSS